jgi:hypothetical protein
MKLTHALVTILLGLSAGACAKKDSKDQPAGTSTEAAKTTDKAPAAGGRKIPNSSGLVVDAPAKWQDNGIGGAAGMHLDGDAGMFIVQETSAEEAAKKLADFKTDTESMGVNKWVSADETPDGFKTLYVVDKLTMKGEEMVKDGTQFAFHVRRKIGDKTYDCSGSAAAQETATEAIDLCTKIAAK